MLEQDLNGLYEEIAGSIMGEQQPQVGPQDIQALAQLIQQIPQAIPDNSGPMFAGIMQQMAALSQRMAEMNNRLTELEAKQPTAQDVYRPILNDLKKTRTKTVIFEVQTDQYGFPEKVIAKEKTQR